MSKQIRQSITFNDLENDIFSKFSNDKLRIKKISNDYKNTNLVNAFKLYYGLEELDQTLFKNTSVNNVVTLELGKVYNGNVESFTDKGIYFTIPGVKDEIICKENFNDVISNVNNYLLEHDNKLLFEVREKKNNTYIVSVIGGYYKKWTDSIQDAINTNKGINVHIDELVRGGYMCHTVIDTLFNLTGRNYTHSVFIPGSHIVLNIESDFDQWVGQDVVIVPQKFVDFKTNYHTGEVEKSLVGSRKKVLQILGIKNLYDIYNKYILAQKNETVSFNNVFDGTVTGIINSQKKTGIFVELNDQYITGLVPMEVMDLIDYKPGDLVKVKISEFEQKEGVDPFVINERTRTIKICNVRPVFELL